MTVSFTKEEVSWLFACFDVATKDVDKELKNELLVSVKKKKKKLRIAQVKETFKRK